MIQKNRTIIPDGFLIKKIPSLACKNCGSFRMKETGFTNTDGHLCEECQFYTRASGEVVGKVTRIMNPVKAHIFEKDLRFK